MWNINFKRGTIWRVKSVSEYTENYQSMGFTPYNVLIMSTFIDENNVFKFTYLILNNRRDYDYKTYIDIIVKDKLQYAEVDRLLTGDFRALDYYIGTLSEIKMQEIEDLVKIHFSLFRKPVLRTKEIKENDKAKSKQIMIHKFGIDIYVVESNNVKISKAKKLLLSDSAREDIIYNSKTEEDIKLLSERYQIYPLKAIREIRNRLVYQHKQKEG